MDEFIKKEEEVRQIRILTISLVIGAGVTDRDTEGHGEESVPRPVQMVSIYLGVSGWATYCCERMSCSIAKRSLFRSALTGS